MNKKLELTKKSCMHAIEVYMLEYAKSIDKHGLMQEGVTGVIENALADLEIEDTINDLNAEVDKLYEKESEHYLSNLDQAAEHADFEYKAMREMRAL